VSSAGGWSQYASLCRVSISVVRSAVLKARGCMLVALCTRARQLALDKRCAMNPERFVRGRPTVPMPPTSVALNRVEPAADGEVGVDERVNFPTLAAAGFVK